MNSITERRRFPRFPVYCPVQYRCDNKNLRDNSITLNISEGGALISTRNFIDIATPLTLRIFLKNENFFAIGRVVHITREPGTKGYAAGIEFQERPARFKIKFNEEIDAITLYQRQCIEESGREVSLTEASMKWYQDSSSWL